MPPIYVLRADGSFEEIIIENLPLGIIDEIMYELTEFKLHSGDSIILTSDGLSERFNADQEFLGFERLSAAVAQIDATTLTAPELLEQVAHIGDSWAQDHPLYDDVTLVVMRVK